MKKLSLYIFLGLLWCSVGFAEEKNTLDLSNLEGVTVITNSKNDLLDAELKVEIDGIKITSEVGGNLRGKKLYCAGQDNHYSFIFTYFSKVKVININPNIGKLKPFKEYTYKYIEYPASIIFKAQNKKLRDYELNRENLRLYPFAYTYCKPVAESFNLEKKMKNIYDIIAKSKKSKNKF
ncbi:MAG: hypothetical protein QF864_08950 [SAR202 cluster bacterium]|nr:hypothetical protein [SAR202 cluster bacterium]